MNDYKERKYLSAIEVAKYLGITVNEVHKLLKIGKLKGYKSVSGQYRFELKNVKLIYAQSSDIKSRTYIEYRRDMKKKAIAELEIIEWLQNKLIIYLNCNNVTVKKSGSDKFIWFLKNGGITREPDFEVETSKNKKFFIEFQYADKENLEYYDFKISKVSKKIKGKITPHSDRIIFYIMKSSYRYAFIKPEWIVENGKIGSVPAWGSRQAYRVPKNKFDKILLKDETLKPVLKIIEAKTKILYFQHELLNEWKEKLSKEI